MLTASNRASTRSARPANRDSGECSVGFRYESEMTFAVARWLRRARFTVRTEFQTGSGVSDVVGCKWRPSAVRARLRAGQRRPLGPLLRVAIWDAIPSRLGIQEEKLAERFADICGAGAVSAELDRLARDKFIRRSDDGRLSRLGSWRDVGERVVAVELKLTRPTEALRQAREYLTFADEVFVALPARMAAAASQGPRGALFADSGVGVLGVSTHGVRVVVQPDERRRAHALDRVARLHAVERLWRDYLDAAQHELAGGRRRLSRSP